MAHGRGTARSLMPALVLLCVLLHSELADSAEYTVGDSGGWTFPIIAGWPQGKRFRAGDVLLFKYQPGVHNVVVVDAAGYSSCSLSGRTYSSGNDRVTLSSGTNFFICGVSDHCVTGMKMVVTAD